ncbi:hypothetical protein, partial [Vulcanococcus sp.]|uniref:hypothetical protein n=1 Tax=Vulcanococcus sp. TaxID=2856995 RepID=UPI003C0C8242
PHGALASGNAAGQANAPLRSLPAFPRWVSHLALQGGCVALYDPVYSRGFYRSRSGRVMARAILIFSVGVCGWVVMQHPAGLLVGLVLIPLFIRWRKS